MSKFLNDGISAVRTSYPGEVVQRLTVEEAQAIERLAKIRTDLEIAKAEAEKIEETKAKAPAAASFIEKKIAPEARISEWMTKLKKALAALDPKDRKNFLEKHEVERVALVGEGKALAMIKELEAPEME
jgi:hypothetical protein